MKYLLVGLALGVPVGMLLADLAGGHGHEIQNNTEEWLQSGRQSAQDFAARVREIATDIRARSDARDTAQLVDQVAARARQKGAAETESAMLNRVGRDELLSVYGIGPVLADRILRGRPYSNDHEVVENGIINQQTFEQLRRQVLVKHESSF